MSSYLELLSQNNSKTLTLNGAVTWSRTGNACLDLFAVAGGMRYRSAGDLINLFTRAYIEEPDTAMKLLFYIRDIRCGINKKKTFRTLRSMADLMICCVCWKHRQKKKSSTL